MTDIIKRRILGLDGRRQSFVKSMCDQAGRGIAGGHFLGKSGDSVSLRSSSSKEMLIASDFIPLPIFP